MPTKTRYLLRFGTRYNSGAEARKRLRKMAMDYAIPMPDNTPRTYLTIAGQLRQMGHSNLSFSVFKDRKGIKRKQSSYKTLSMVYGLGTQKQKPPDGLAEAIFGPLPQIPVEPLEDWGDPDDDE